MQWVSRQHMGLSHAYNFFLVMMSCASDILYVSIRERCSWNTWFRLERQARLTRKFHQKKAVVEILLHKKSCLYICDTLCYLLAWNVQPIKSICSSTGFILEYEITSKGSQGSAPNYRPLRTTKPLSEEQMLISQLMIVSILQATVRFINTFRLHKSFENLLPKFKR
jgi:hypothetical protein